MTVKVQTKMSDLNANAVSFTISNLNEAKIPVGSQEEAVSDTSTLMSNLDNYMRQLCGLTTNSYVTTNITAVIDLNEWLEEHGE